MPPRAVTALHDRLDSIEAIVKSNRSETRQIADQAARLEIWAGQNRNYTWQISQAVGRPDRKLYKLAAKVDRIESTLEEIKRLLSK